MMDYQARLIADGLNNIASALERLAPAGSTPASCCPTRGAVGEQGAVTNSDTDSPLPDQGGGERPQRSDLTEYSEWFNSDEAAELLHPLDFKPGSDQWPIIAAVFVAGRRSVRREPLTQSAADGDETKAAHQWELVHEWLGKADRYEEERAERAKDGDLLWSQALSSAASTYRECAAMLKVWLPKESRKERSVSGNR